MMLEDIFRENNYPELAVTADLLRGVIRCSKIPAGEVERRLLDELKHIAVKAFHLKEVPD